MTEDSWSELTARCVQPFYRQMMGTNALEATPSVLAEMAALVDTVDPALVIALLRSDWRDQVIGAWLSLAHRYDESVLRAVINALETSDGNLTAPALLTAMTVMEAPSAAASISRYYEADVANHWGFAGLAQAAAEHFPDSQLPRPSAVDAQTFLALSVIANCLKPAGGHAVRVLPGDE